jgi:hypothetical protein
LRIPSSDRNFFRGLNQPRGKRSLRPSSISLGAFVSRREGIYILGVEESNLLSFETS